MRVPLLAERAAMPSADLLWVERDGQTLTQRVCDSLRDAILSGRFEPGKRLVERTLCEMTGVSRTAVREALRALETEGLVVNVPNRGPTVVAIGLEEAMEIYDVRQILETRAVELFVKRMTEEELKALSEAMTEMERAYEARDFERIHAEKRQFYAILVNGCGNRTVARMLGQLHAKIAVLRNMTMAQESRTRSAIAEMRVIFDAIKERDVRLAKRACWRHVEAAATVALEALRHCEDIPSS